MLSVIRNRLLQRSSNFRLLSDFVLSAVSASLAAAMATVVWANGAGGIVIPMLIGVAAGVICLVSAFRAGAAKRIVAAYAQGRLDTESFLERLDPCARAALSFRMAVICLGPAVMACVIAAAFPGRVVAAPIAAALLAVVLLRFCGAAGYRTGGGWFFDALIPDEVVLDMTGSADAWARFRAGWTLDGRVAVLRQAAALRSDLPQEVRQIVLAQYSPHAIFVPVRLVPKSVGSELRLMLAGGRVGGAAMALAAILALMAVLLLPRDLLRIPALNELELPALQSPPDESPQDPDTPAGGRDQSGNEAGPGPSGASGERGAGAGGSSAGQQGGDPTSGESAAGKGQSGQAPASADRQDQPGAQAGEDAAQQGGNAASDAAGGADGEQPGADDAGSGQQPGAGPASGEGGAPSEALDGSGPGQKAADQQGQACEGGAQAGKDAAEQGQQGAEAASDAAGRGKPGAGEAGQDPGDGQAADAGGGDAASRQAGGAKAAPADSAAGEGGRPEPSRSGDSSPTQGTQAGSDPGATERAGAGPEDTSAADATVPAAPGQAGASSDAVPADEVAGDASGAMREHVDQLPEGGRITWTKEPEGEADRELRISPPLDDDTAGTPVEAPELREAAQPPQADVALDLKAGGPAALFAEKGAVPEAVEARLLPDESAPPPSQAMPGEARQILPAWIDELMK